MLNLSLEIFKFFEIFSITFKKNFENFTKNFAAKGYFSFSNSIVLRIDSYSEFCRGSFKEFVASNFKYSCSLLDFKCSKYFKILIIFYLILKEFRIFKIVQNLEK